eukprot:2169049-Ditylum_brightwellii.AAC.1
MEGRDVATVDIPGAFMQAEMDDTVHMKIEGTMAEILTKLDPKMHCQCLRSKKGKPVLYVQLKKALYGTLKEWGFEINPYNWCVANKIIKCEQCTIVWYVDDLKISHEDPKVVKDIINKLKEKYGKEAPLTVKRGKIHDSLGMTLDFSSPKK